MENCVNWGRFISKISDLLREICPKIVPKGEIKALIPVLATRAMLIPSSTALSCVVTRCWYGPADSPYQPSLVRFISHWGRSFGLII